MEKMDLAHRTTFNLDELEALFKFIPSSQLLTFRHVSKELDEVAQLVLRKRRDVKLILTTDNLHGRTNWEFLQFLNDSSKAFVAPVIHIKNANRSDQDLEEGRICATFHIIREICERLGNRGIVKKLIIEDGKNAPHFTSDFVFALLNNLSSLEILEMKELQLKAVMTEQKNRPNFQLPFLKQMDFQYGYLSDGKEIRNLLKIILESSPNLEIVTGWYLHELDIISMLKETGLSKMKEITLTKPADLDILLQCQPKIVLNSFSIYSEDVIDSKKLFTLLQQQADNLKIFGIDAQCLPPESIFTMPVLPVLEKLSFKSWSHGCLLSVNYGKDTPALKSLEICSSTSDDYPSWDEFLSYEISSEMPPCLSLEKLKLRLVSGVGPSYKGLYDVWKNLFPNVKKLSFDNPEEFDIEQFIKCWPKLETLSLRLESGFEKEENADLDELLFGICPDCKEEIDTTEEEWWIKVPAPEIKETQTVANLESLKKLKVEVEDYWGTISLTDFAVYFGLNRMQNLRCLEITTAKYAQGIIQGLSTEGFNFLVKNLPNLEKLDVLGQKWERGDLK